MDVVGFVVIAAISAYAAWRIKSAERQMREAIQNAAHDIIYKKLSPDDLVLILRGYIPGVDKYK